MNMNMYLDEVCRNIKCRSVHADVRNELSAHIYDLAKEHGCPPEEILQYMGKPEEIGAMFNKCHKMPFNSRRGLLLWAALYSFLIGMTFPFLSDMFIADNYTIFFTLIPLIFIFIAANRMILKRCRLKISAADAAETAVGALIGTAAGIIISAALVFAGIFDSYAVLEFQKISAGSKYIMIAIIPVTVLSAAAIYFSSCVNSSPKGEAPYYELDVFMPLKYDVDAAFGEKSGGPPKKRK